MWAASSYVHPVVGASNCCCGVLMLKVGREQSKQSGGFVWQVRMLLLSASASQTDGGSSESGGITSAAAVSWFMKGWHCIHQLLGCYSCTGWGLLQLL